MKVIKHLDSFVDFIDNDLIRNFEKPKETKEINNEITTIINKI